MVVVGGIESVLFFIVGDGLITCDDVWIGGLQNYL